jgi:hypothetical protein
MKGRELMDKVLRAAVLEHVDKDIDYFELPDSDITEGEEPDYRIVVASVCLLTLGVFLLLRNYVKRHKGHRT